MSNSLIRLHCLRRRGIARISRGRSGSWGFVDVRTPGLTCRIRSLGSAVVRFGIVHTAEVGSSSLPSPTTFPLVLVGVPSGSSGAGHVACPREGSRR